MPFSLVRGRRKLAAAAAALFVAAGAASAIAPAANADSFPEVPNGHVYRITTSASLALDVSGGSLSDGAPVIQWPINGGANQSWRVVDAGQGFSFVINDNSGKCLTIAGGTGSGLVQSSCRYGAQNQQWWLPQDSINAWWGNIMYSGLQNGLSVDVPGGSIAWGQQLVAWPFHHGMNQAFHFTQLR
jgi:hypothetical protein